MKDSNQLEHRLDRNAFKMQTAKEASGKSDFCGNKTDAEKLRAAYHLSLRAGGYDPENEPRLDRTKFSSRKSA